MKKILGGWIPQDTTSALIESTELVITLQAEITRLTEQRDALLEALKKFLTDNNTEGFGCACELHHMCGPCAFEERVVPLRNAIAAVEGEKG